MLYLIADAARLSGRPQPDPLHHLPRRRGERDGAAHRPAARPAVHRLAAHQAGQGPADPRATARRAISAKRGTPTMGGLLILTSVSDLDAAVDGPPNRVHLGVPAGHRSASARSASLDDYDKVTQAHHAGLSGKVRLLARVRHRRHRGLAHRPHRPAPGSTCRSSRKPVIDLGWFYIAVRRVRDRRRRAMRST